MAKKIRTQLGARKKSKYLIVHFLVVLKTFSFSAPILPPAHIQVNVTGESSFTVTWNKTVGQISGYMATAKSLSSNSSTGIAIATCSNKSTVTFKNLSSFTTYNITVFGFDTKQLGMMASTIATTQQRRKLAIYFAIQLSC